MSSWILVSFPSCWLVIMSSCHLVILSSCHHVILSSCHHVIVSSSCHVIISSCHHVVSSSCPLVIMSSCHHFIMSSWPHVNISTCDHVNMWTYHILMSFLTFEFLLGPYLFFRVVIVSTLHVLLSSACYPLANPPHPPPLRDENFWYRILSLGSIFSTGCSNKRPHFVA